MAKTLVIQPVTRIEGHAKVTIQLNDAGNVDLARVNVIELRGFEKFCLGRPVEDMPRIMPRICGVCPGRTISRRRKPATPYSGWTHLQRARR